MLSSEKQIGEVKVKVLLKEAEILVLIKWSGMVLFNSVKTFAK